MTEAAHQISSNYLPPGQRKVGSVGQGRGVEIMIMDDNGRILPSNQVGEVCIRGLNIINGRASAFSFFQFF